MVRQYYPNTQMTGAAIVNISRSDNKFDSFTVRDCRYTPQISGRLKVRPGVVITQALARAMHNRSVTRVLARFIQFSGHARSVTSRADGCTDTCRRGQWQPSRGN